MELRERWQAAARLIARHRDVLDARAGAGETPPPLAARGWSSFLASIDDATLDTLERRGPDTPWPDATPSSLLELVAESREVCMLPSFSTAGDEVRALRRRETPRKRAQIEAFARLVLPLAAGATRVVDVGSGHGHLTREIAERIARPVVGFERDAALADRARSLPSTASPAFAVTDVLADGLALSPGDCVIGLHACGELGDAIVESAARSGAAVALVGCCLQKRRAEARSMLCASEHGAALDLPRNILGLSNLSPGDDGVEATRVENLDGRVNRLALHRLLSEDGTLRLGAEIDGLNRRASHGALETFVARAFAVRSLPVPSKSAIEDAAGWARTQHGRARRMTLPRATLARALEVLVLLDRALYLEEHGFVVSVGALFPASVSARNLALAARR